ncbi:MAG: LysR family transcriptional regulator, partial [Clostridia bacterium]|nr:LysR family transcriptional regulator [Clostridia bacterium]
MELRELKYFLAVAREQSISKAAASLFVTQPNLSRQMQNLEKEIGQQLFIRGTRKITLTKAGKLLYKRAEELIELYDKTQSELSAPITDISGDVYIGGGESYVLGLIAKAAYDVLK